MTDPLSLPAGDELADRIRRMARIVVFADGMEPPHHDAFVMALWEIIIGVDDTALAIEHARRIARQRVRV